MPMKQGYKFMSLFLIIVGASVMYLLAGKFYAPIIGKVLQEKSDRKTPAVRIDDGRDYVPTKTPIVFAHHFASIAGAGPIIGPVIALIYGWGPTLLWIILGGIFLGAVHDYVATHVALREGGKSITITCRRHVGKGAFILLLLLLISAMTLVCACFLGASAKALTSQVALSDMGLVASQTLFTTFNGKALIGGIASTSVIVITLCSPFLGFLYIKKQWPTLICSCMAIAICAMSIWIGFLYPVRFSGFEFVILQKTIAISGPQVWMLLIATYVLFSAGLPVWIFLQSRDFINVHILYLGLIMMFVSVISATLKGGGHFGFGDAIPFNNIAEGKTILGYVWPIMFITIACGAVSGFHSLCAGGTTCKQLNNEGAARQVGYYGMLLESFFSVCVVSSVLIGLSYTGYLEYCHPIDGAKGNWILTFAVAVGQTIHTGFSGLPVWCGVVGAMLLLEGFLVTTLDTAIRLVRYLFEEAWSCLFANYDVYAEKAQRDNDHILLKQPGDDGLDVGDMPIGEQVANPIKTKGVLRWVLKLLQHYWVNSGFAVALMLWMGFTGGFVKLWGIFGATNQLLAAIALLLCSVWLFKRGQTIKYTMIPALFMLMTSMSALLISLFKTGGYIDTQNMPLMCAAIIILLLAVGIVTLVVKSIFTHDDQVS